MPNRISKHRRQAFSLQACRCYYCGCLMWDEDPSSFAQRHAVPPALIGKVQCTAEHLKARCNGGGNSKPNIVAACWLCNHRRPHVPTAVSPERYREHVRAHVRNGSWHTTQIRHLMESQ